MIALSAKYFEKKAKISTILSVGENPQITPGSLESASLVTWSEILNQTEQIGKERQRFSNELSLQIADQMHGIQLRYDDLRKRFVGYHDKLVEDRESYYADLKKAKANYDAACQTMENQRVKSSKSSYDKDKATRKMSDKEHVMNDAKNVYLIKLNVGNRIKDKYFHQDVPDVLDNLQELNESRVSILNAFWNQSVGLEKACLDRITSDLDSMSAMIAQNHPGLDSAMFVKHNLKPWTEPEDFYYQPSPIWHDDEKMITDDAALQFLGRRLGESNKKLGEYNKAFEARLEVYRTLQEQKKNASKSQTTPKGGFIDLLGKSLTGLQALAVVETSKVIQEVEVETIEVAAGHKDLSVQQSSDTKKHRRGFGLRRKKTTTVSTSTNGEASSAGRSNSTSGHGFFNSLLGRSKSSRTTQASGGQGSKTVTKAKALYAYSPTEEGELEIDQDDELVVVQPDDGSGWVEVQLNGQSGLVPASYVEILETVVRTESINSVSTSATGESKKKGPAVAPKRGGKKINYKIALYDYDATAEEEITIRAGDKITVINEDSGDGWTEGELNGMSGIFPTSYARDA